MTRKATSIRVPESWLDRMSELAEHLGVSRTSAIMVAAALGRRVMLNVRATEEQLRKLMEG